MQNTAGFLSPAWLLILTAVLCTVAVNGDHWNYEAEEKWPEKCLRGQHQSPINLQRDTAEQRIFTDLQFKNYDTKYMTSITNNGHSVALKLLDARPAPSVKGGGLPHQYVVDHLHFHWESEHTIHSNRFPLELHIVHYANIFNSTRAALGYDQGLAVLGVLFDISKYDNPAVEPLIEMLEDVKKEPGKSENLNDAIAISSFLPKNTESFFRYEGSLTTPGCDEVVVWTVFYQSSYISKRQMEYFSAIWSPEGILKANYRSLQKLNDRVITYRAGSYSGSHKFTCSSPAVLLLATLVYITNKYMY